MRASFARLTATLRALCYRPDFTDTRGDSPAALGNRIAAATIAYGRSDGSLEAQHYVDMGYTPVNEPLVVSQPGGTMHDRTFWQPLALGEVVVQAGLPVPASVQTFVGSQWGRVRPFALPKNLSAIDPGAPPTGDPSSAAYEDAAVDAIRHAAAGGRLRHRRPRTGTRSRTRSPTRRGRAARVGSRRTSGCTSP